MLRSNSMVTLSEGRAMTTPLYILLYNMYKKGQAILYKLYTIVFVQIAQK